MCYISSFNRKGFVFINKFFTKQEVNLINSVYQQRKQNEQELLTRIIKSRANINLFNNDILFVTMTNKNIMFYDNFIRADCYLDDWIFHNNDLLIHKYDINKENLITFNFKKYRNNYFRV